VGYHSSTVHLGEEPAVHKLDIFGIRFESMLVVSEDSNETTISDKEGTLVVLKVSNNKPVVNGKSCHSKDPVPEGDLHFVGIGIINIFLTSELKVVGVQANSVLRLVEQRHVVVLQYDGALSDGSTEDTMARIDVIEILEESKDVLNGTLVVGV
jgi:hypothetical protein